MITWIFNAIGLVSGIPSAIYNFVKSAIEKLWHPIEWIFREAVKAWHWLVKGFDIARDLLVRGARATFNFAKNLLTNYLPHLTKWIVKNVGDFAKKLVNTLESWVKSAFNAVYHWAQAIINTLKDWATSLFKWITARLSDVWNLLQKAAKLVFHLLDSADHLVAWMFGSLVKFLWRYLQANALRVARWLFRSFVAIAMAEVNFIEGLISRVL